MNSVHLIGRLTSDPKINQAQYGIVVRYTLAVDRQRSKEGEQNTDFISCVCFGKAAEFAQRYLSKGMKIGVEGSIRTGSFQKDGQTVFTTDVNVLRHDFCEKKDGSGQQYQQRQAAQNQQYQRPQMQQQGYQQYQQQYYNAPPPQQQQMPHEPFPLPPY